MSQKDKLTSFIKQNLDCGINDAGGIADLLIKGNFIKEQPLPPAPPKEKTYGETSMAKNTPGLVTTATQAAASMWKFRKKHDQYQAHKCISSIVAAWIDDAVNTITIELEDKRRNDLAKVIGDKNAVISRQVQNIRTLYTKIDDLRKQLSKSVDEPAKIMDELNRKHAEALARLSFEKDAKFEGISREAVKLKTQLSNATALLRQGQYLASYPCDNTCWCSTCKRCRDFPKLVDDIIKQTE